MKVFNSKKLKFGSLSVVFACIFISIIIVLNLLFYFIFNHFNIKFDLTDNQIYKISDQTKTFIKNYPNNAEIFVLDNEDTFKSQSTYSLEAYNILKNMVSYNDKLKLSFVDLDQNPNFSSKYSDVTLQTGGILIEDDKNHHTYISSTDLFLQAYDQTTGDTTELLSNVEQSVARALEYISGENPINTLVMTGHSETDLSSLKTSLEKNGYKFNTVNLTTSDINENTDLIVIAAPTIDYTKEDIEKLESYISGGGAIAYFASARQSTLPNLEGFLKSYGITFSDGTVMETDSDYMLNNSSSSFCVYASNNDYTKDMPDKTLPIAVSEAKPMEGEEGEGYELTDICSTQDSCVLNSSSDFNFDYKTAEHKSFETALGSVKKLDNEKEAVVTAFSNVQILGTLDSPTFANGNFILSVLGQATNHHSQISILPKSIKSADLGATENQIIFIGFLFMLIIPILTIIVGIIVYVKRKQTKR